jgi:serine/threonine-protein kinase
VKRLRPELRSSSALLRFAEEVRIIGQLEHPNITPVHDVGIDEQGQHYFVMKYIEGDTLEAIIERLRAGDEATLRRFTPEYRVELFMGVLNAVSYAHARGIIHRDLKPSNIMIGPFGEVTVMDWGIAKKIRGDGATTAEPAGVTDDTSPPGDPRLRTRQGQLIGTPMYMSPEQAAGDIASLDERSDIFSLSLVFFELMSLTHPLANARTVHELIAKLSTEQLGSWDLRMCWVKSGAACEWRDFALRGLQKDRAKRYQSLDEMLAAGHAVLTGKIPVTCHVTATKRAAAEFTHWIDRAPLGFGLLFLGAVAGTGYAAFSAFRGLLHWLM